MEGEEITAAAGDETAGDDTTKQPESFRETTEARLGKLESSTGTVPVAGADFVDEAGNSLTGRVRVLEARMEQLEAIQATNTENILKLSELCQTQYAGAAARIAALEETLKPA